MSENEVQVLETFATHIIHIFFTFSIPSQQKERFQNGATTSHRANLAPRRHPEAPCLPLTFKPLPTPTWRLEWDDSDMKHGIKKVRNETHMENYNASNSWVHNVAFVLDLMYDCMMDTPSITRVTVLHPMFLFDLSSANSFPGCDPANKYR